MQMGNMLQVVILVRHVMQRAGHVVALEQIAQAVLQINYF